MQKALTLSGITKKYGDVVALHPTDLTIQAGEFLTLLGPSGSGKTTLLMTLAGFVEPTAGRIELDSKDVTKIQPEQRNFGVVFQGYALFPHMTVWDNVWFPLRARNCSRQDAKREVDEILELMELGPYSQRMPREISGGQQQRVALARALVFKPELLLLDEPLSALDKALRKTLQTQLKSLHRKLGTTFVYVTHDQEEALSMSDRIAILNHGRIQQIDCPDTLYRRPKSQFVAGFLGRSNFIQGKFADSNAGIAEITTPVGTIAAMIEQLPSFGDDVCVVVRPELIGVSTEAPETDNCVSGTVLDTTFLGGQLDLEVDVQGKQFSASIPASLISATTTLQPGTLVWLSWPASAGLVLPTAVAV
jgi:putative spermidine/putrescine transport system ATP-binding protein